MKNFLKKIVFFIFFILVVGGICSGIYFFSPEIKPGKIGLVFNSFGRSKGFTGKTLPPGKYYWFVSGIYPILNKIYTIKVGVSEIKIPVDIKDKLSIVYKINFEIDSENIKNYIKRSSNLTVDKILSVYITSDTKEIISDFKINDFFNDNFDIMLSKKLQNILNKELKYFGLEVNKIIVTSKTFSREMQDLYKKYKETEKKLKLEEIALLKKLKEEKLNNKLKEEKLKFLIKKAEIEKQAALLKRETAKILREEAKKRLLMETEIFSKPGGALAAKLEAIRILSQSGKNVKELEIIDSFFEK